MAPRKAISKKLRFEVFKRDNFTCQYCGKSAPDVVLHLDHINPVAKGGGPDILNLITSCADCNSGKSDRMLGDKTMLEKQKKQLMELSERREQLKLMVKWREELTKFDDYQISEIEKIFAEATGHSFNQHGKGTINRLIKKYGFGEVHESTIASIRGYYKEIDESSIQKTFNYIGRICACRARETKNPHLKELYYIRGIVRNRMYCNDYKCLELLNNAVAAGVDIEVLKEFALQAKNWTEFCECVDESYM